jgi:polar amino acid transport system substrate-binding protein
MKLTKKIIGVFAVLIVIIIMVVIYSGLTAGCDGPGKSEEGQLTIFRNKILVGTDATYPPFEYVHEGNLEGFDIDIAAEIASRLDKEMEIVPITWDFTYRIPEDIRLDMIISAVSADEDKEEFVDFSDPYYMMEYMLIVLSDAELKIKEDLKGKRVGIIDIRVKDLDPEYLKDFIIEEYKDVLIMMEDLRNREIDGVLKSVPLGKNIIEENSGIYRVLETVGSLREFNMVFHDGSPLREEVNRILQEMVEDGTYQQIYDNWFSFSSQ